MKDASHHTIKLDRENISDEEKRIFHEVLALSLEYKLNIDPTVTHSYTKKELKSTFNIADQ